MTTLPPLVLANLESTYGPHCVKRATPGLQNLLDAVVGLAWASVPPWIEKGPAPLAVAVSSPRAHTEVRHVGNRSLVVFDEGLQSFFASITHHVVARSDIPLLHILLERLYASRLFVAGRDLEAAAVGILANAGIAEHRGGPAVRQDDANIIRQLTSAQTVFTAAHETWHVAVKGHARDRRSDEFLRNSIDRYVSGQLPGITEPRSDPVVIVREMQLAWQLAGLGSRSWTRSQRFELIAASVREHRLSEEMECDLFGATVTVEMMRNLGVSRQAAISGCVLALLNLAVFDFFDSVADGHSERAATKLQQTSVRVEVLMAGLAARASEAAPQAAAGAVEAVLFNVAVAVNLYERAIIPLVETDWRGMPGALLEDASMRADAVRVSENVAHLSGLVGFAYPGYR